MLYGNQRDLLRLAPELRAAYPVWLAEYDVEVPPLRSTSPFGSTPTPARFPACPTDVDLNV